MTRNLRQASQLLIGCALFAAGCGDREEKWDARFTRGATVGLTGSVAMADLARDELMMLTTHGDNELAVERLKIGKNIVTAVPSANRQRLFVLTRGEDRRLKEGDEMPQLFVVRGGTTPEIEQHYDLSNPARQLALDPLGEWAIAFDSGGVVVNLNELMLVKLDQPMVKDENPRPLALRSIGGRPQRFTFTTPLTLPNGETHRLLVVETEQDVAVIDLEHPEVPEITVPLPRTAANQAARPVEVTFHDDVPGGEVASFLAVRFDNDSSVLTLRLGDPKPDSTSTLSLSPNLVDAGNLPTKVDFVETDRGLRLAALVPTVKAAVLFDPNTSKSERVQFDQSYSGIARITNSLGVKPDSGDVALLYSNQAPYIAFWRLGYASATPYASFESYLVDTQISGVLDIPGDEFGHLKLLTGQNQQEFFVLDLDKHESYPMQAVSGFSLSLAPDGQRAWAFQSGAFDFARLTFDNRHPTSFAVERGIAAVFDIEKRDGGRSTIVLHDTGDDAAVTLFDALNPDSAHTRFVGELKFEGVR